MFFYFGIVGGSCSYLQQQIEPTHNKKIKNASKERWLGRAKSRAPLI